MSSRSSASNNRTEFIYQRNNCSRNSWEASEAPSCENLVVNRGFPDQTYMDCHKKLSNPRNSSTTQEDESYPSPRHQLCEFHHRIVHHHSPRRSHHVSKCSTNSDRRFNQDNVANSTRQLEQLTPISCRANSYPERICRSIHQDRLHHTAKCSASSKNVEGVEIKRNATRTPRSVYTKQPIDVYPQDARGNTNEGCCKHSSPNVQSPHSCLTPTSTDSGPGAYEQKSSKKFCESSTSPLWNEAAEQFPSSSFKKQNSFDEDVRQEYSRTKAKEICFDPYTTTDFFTKSCGSTTVQTLQEVPSDRNRRSPNEMDPYNSKLQIDTEKPCSTCTRRRSSRKDSLQSAFKEASFSRNPDEDLIRRSSCNKPSIAKCMSAREMPCETLRSSGKQCCPFKCPSQPPLKVSFTCKATDTVPSREDVQLKKQIPTRERVTDFVENRVSKEGTCVGKSVQDSVIFEGDKPLESRDFSPLSRLKLCDSVEKMQAEKSKQKFASPMAIAKKSCEQMALKLLNAERPKFPGPRCLLGVSFDDAIIDFLSCFQAPEGAKSCKVSKSMDSQVKLKLLTWLNEQYETLGRDCIEAKTQTMRAQSSLSSESLAERKKILDSLSRLIGVKKGCTFTISKEELKKKVDSETRKRSMGSKIEEHQGADLEDTNDVTINRTDANPNYLDRFPYRKRDDCSKKIVVCQPNIIPANACSFSCSANEDSLEGASKNKQEPCLSKLDENEVQLSVDFNQKIRLCTPSQRSPETERSSGYHSEIFERGTPLGGPGLSSQSRAFNDTLFTKSATRSPSSNASNTSESSQNYRNTLMQQKLPRYSKPSSRENDALSRITERSSEKRSADEDFRKVHRMDKSSVSFREDLIGRDSELEINCPGTGLKQEPRMSYSRQTTPPSILRQNSPEQTNETCANPERSSQINESPNLVSIRTSKQYNISCSPENVSGAAKMLMENIKQPLQTCTKPNLEVCASKRHCGTVGTNKDKGNISQNEVLVRNSESIPPCIGSQYGEFKRQNCPIHSTQTNSGSLQLINSFQKSGCPCSQKKLSYCHKETSTKVPFSSQNLSNRKSQRNIIDGVTKAKSEYFETKRLEQSIPNQQLLSEPKVLSSNKVQHLQPSSAKMSQIQMTSSLDYRERGQQPTEFPFQNSPRIFTTQCNANPSSSGTTRNNSSICTEDYSSQSETWSQSPCSYEADVDPTQQIGITVKLKKPFEIAHISYSRTLQPKQTPVSQKEAFNKECECLATSPKQEQHRSPLKPNLSSSVLRNTRTICQSPNNSYTNDQDREKYQSLSVLEKSSQYGASRFKASEAHTPDNTRLLDQFPENYRGSNQMCDMMCTSTQEQLPIIETSNSIPSVTGGSNYNDIIEDFPDDQEQPHESIYINSEEELSFCEASYSKAREALASNMSFKSVEIGKQDENASMSLRSCGTEEPIGISKTSSFKRICNGCLQEPSSYQPSHIQSSKDIDIVASYEKDIFVDFPDNADKKTIESMHLDITEELSRHTTYNSNQSEGLEAATVEKISERETIEESFQINGNQERDETALFDVDLDIRSSVGCVPESCLQKFPEGFASEQDIECMCINEQAISSHQTSYSKPKTGLRPTSTDRETRKEIVDRTVQMYADENLGTENNETAAFTTSRSPARRIYDTCLQKCSKIGKLKTELKKLQMIHKGGMPGIDTCQSRHPCESQKCHVAPLRECQAVRPKEFCCELHHKDNNMCIYIDLCKCRGAKENVGLYSTHKHKTFHYDNATRPHLEGSGGPPCTESRTEEVDHFGPVSGEPHHQRRIYRALSTQTRNQCEKHKRSIPRKIKWAVAKISVFDDSSKTYELIQAQPIKPIKCTPNSESVVILVPENHN